MPEVTVRVGIGVDVHPFCQGRQLYLACLYWPGETGLSGHSDGDVAAHAHYADHDSLLAVNRVNPEPEIADSFTDMVNLLLRGM